MEDQKDQNNSTFPGGSGGRSGKDHNNRRPNLREILRLLFWIGLVVAVGMLAINQSLGFFYKAHFLKQPCDLCGELNPEVKQCIEDLNDPRPSFPDGSGGWTDPFEDQVKYNITLP